MTPKPAPLLQGTLELIVLQLLRAEPTNGYDLSLRIQSVSSDVLNVNAGSLYPALHRLERDGLITGEWQVTENQRRARVYSITRDGKKRLAEATDNWKNVNRGVARMLRYSS